MNNPANPAAPQAPPTAPDLTMTIGQSLVQHGRASDRVYLMAAADRDMPELLTRLEALARQNRYGKIFAKLPGCWRQQCLAAGFRVEAEVPGFYQGRESGLFLGKYLDDQRSRADDREKIAEVLELCRKARPDSGDKADRSALQNGYRTRLCKPADTPAMAALFRQVFPSYPFPVHDPDFLRQAMKEEEVSYAGAWQGEQLAALAAAEYSQAAAHAEMTDFATAPEHRRQQLAARLLKSLEEEMTARGIKVAYTIARAVSAGINLTFAQAGYHYAGTLINNTQICGRIESMNIWYRRLQ